MEIIFSCLAATGWREKRLWLEVKWVQGSILKDLSMFKHRRKGSSGKGKFLEGKEVML